MPLLVIEGTTIPIALDGAEEDVPELIGDRGVTFDGSLREVNDGVKRRWPLRTPPLSSAEYATIRGTLIATPPLSCSGDLTGSMNGFVELTGESLYRIRGQLFRAIRFKLLQA